MVDKIDLWVTIILVIVTTLLASALSYIAGINYSEPVEIDINTHMNIKVNNTLNNYNNISNLRTDISFFSNITYDVNKEIRCNSNGTVRLIRDKRVRKLEVDDLCNVVFEDYGYSWKELKRSAMHILKRNFQFGTGIFSNKGYYCVWTEGRSLESINTTVNHEIAHAFVYNNKEHFCNNVPTKKNP